MIANFDILGVIVILFFALRVMARGFVHELLTLGAFFGGIIVAALLSGSVSNIIAPFIAPRIWSQIVAFLLVFVVVYFSVKIVHRFVENSIESINLVNLDRALGFFFGLAEGVAVMIAVILLMQIVPLINEEKIFADSILVRLISPFVPTVLRVFRA